ncbi:MULTISPECIES: RDD family protein [Actinomadura]|uniref:RDD family protein n=1 Tax=Actinomadura litoris TaxID=2678616 RepID=A0A7K1L789_9ACTN|nr:MULTISPECIES: RDD family protein [Actinomadura]MBT2209612.1 RDD family protein [Actinomadura sp. NEAU-AAG7]MUN40301.1 RDD family protein [Actinomadura litoris]
MSGEDQGVGTKGAGPRWTQTWLSGARAAGADLGRPGERFGLPASGSGSVAGYGRRLVALFVDWGLSMLVASLLTRAFEWTPSERSLCTLIVFGVQAWLLTGLAGTTLGKRLCGLRVVRPDGGPVGPVWALARALLLLLVVPALVWDRDYRGLHDRAANTVVVHL